MVWIERCLDQGSASKRIFGFLCARVLWGLVFFFRVRKRKFFCFLPFFWGAKNCLLFTKSKFFCFYEKKVFLLFVKRKFICFSFFLTWINNVLFYMEKQVLVNFKKQYLFILQKQLTIRGPINPYDSMDTNWYPQPVVASINFDLGDFIVISKSKT